MKKKKQQRKRFEAVSVKIDKNHVNPKTGRVEINLMFDPVHDEHKVILVHNNKVVDNHSIITGYIGEKKLRTLSELPSDRDDHSLNPIRKLKRYDRIVAMDTNSATQNGRKISLGIACHVVGKIKKDVIEWELTPINHYFVILGEGDKIENKNWRQLIEYIMKHKNYKPEHRVGLIVDSDLGNLSDFNKRVKPVSDEFYLPTNFELIYASDRANDNILNEVIITCHSISKDILEIFVKSLNKEDEEIKGHIP